MPRIACLIVICSLLFIVRPTRAQDPTYQGLDVLFLVDQSGSMQGTQSRPVPTDPLGLRFEAVQYALQTLSEYQRVVPGGTEFRMSVISFGDTTEITLPWTTIASGTDWTPVQDQLVEQLSQERFGDRDLGNTNFLQAFQVAQSQFNSLGDAGRRLKVIIVLTDGAPCAPTLFVEPNCTNFADQDRHMLDVIDLVETAFSGPDYRLYVIALDSSDEFWPNFSSYWDRATAGSGNAVRVDSSTTVGQRFLEILAELVRALRGDLDQTGGGSSDVIGVPVNLVDQSAEVDVPPFYQAMRITIFKSDTNAGLTITDSTGSVLTAGSPQVTLFGQNSAIETWTIRNPQPGRWRLVTPSTSRLDVYLDLIRIGWDIDIPANQPTRYLAFPITLSIVDSDGNPLPAYADPRYALNVEVTLRAPSGAVEQISLADGGSGLYQGEIIPQQAGSYTLDIMASTQNIDGSPFVVVDEANAYTFEVADINLSAQMNPVRNILMSETVDIEARLIDSNGNRLQPQAVRLDAVARGDTQEDTYRLVLNEDTGMYHAEIAMSDAGQFQISVRAVLEDSSGSSQTIAEEFLPVFQVEPATFVLLRLDQPQPDSTQYTTGGFPPLQPTDLMIEVSTTDANGQPVDLMALANDTLPLQLAVHNADGMDVTGGAALSGTDTLGVYQAAVSGLDAGEFHVRVQADTTSRLGASTLFDPRFSSQALTITRAINPMLIVTIVVIAVLVVGSISGGVYMVLRNIRLSRHPARGTIALLREDFQDAGLGGTVYWSLMLDPLRRNRIVVNRLPLGLKRMVIECNSDNMAKRGQVVISLYGSHRKLFERTTFSRGTKRPLDLGSVEDGVTYYLAKDWDAFNDY